jgi:hypothetical protein
VDARQEAKEALRNALNARNGRTIEQKRRGLIIGAVTGIVVSIAVTLIRLKLDLNALENRR